jgi:hypothetical protein
VFEELGFETGILLGQGKNLLVQVLDRGIGGATFLRPGQLGLAELFLLELKRLLNLGVFGEALALPVVTEFLVQDREQVLPSKSGMRPLLDDFADPVLGFLGDRNALAGARGHGGSRPAPRPLERSNIRFAIASFGEGTMTA